jgi:hypothetical protein
MRFNVLSKLRQYHTVSKVGIPLEASTSILIIVYFSVDRGLNAISLKQSPSLLLDKLRC